MKQIHYLIPLLLFAFPHNVFSQGLISGTLGPLKDIHIANVIVDWSKVLIDDKTEKEWLESREQERPQYDAAEELEKELKQQVIMKFIPASNDITKNKGFKLVRNKKTSISLKIIPLKVKRNGANVCHFEFFYTDSEESFATIELKSDSGIFGSMANLWADGFRNTGVNFGGFMKKEIKKLFK